jgi:hypothetical protein
MLLLLIGMVFFGDHRRFINSAEKAYLQQYELYSILKILIPRKYSLQKLSEFSQGINVVIAPGSKH